MANQDINFRLKANQTDIDLVVKKVGKGLRNLEVNFNLNDEMLREMNNKLNDMVITPSLDTRQVTQESNGLVDGLGMVANGLGILGTAYSVVTTAINYYNQKQEEARQKTFESIQLHKDESREFELLMNQYKDLQSLEQTKEVKEQLVELQRQLIEQYPLEAKGIDFVNGSLDSQIEKLQKISDDKAKGVVISLEPTFIESNDFLNNDEILKGVDQLIYDLNAYLGHTSLHDTLATIFEDFDTAKPTEQLRKLKEVKDAIYDEKKIMKSDKESEGLRTMLSDVLSTVQVEYDKLEATIKAKQNNINDYMTPYFQVEEPEIFIRLAEAVNEYQNAIESGDNTKIEEASQKFQKVKDSVYDVTDGLELSRETTDNYLNSIDTTGVIASFENIKAELSTMFQGSGIDTDTISLDNINLEKLSLLSEYFKQADEQGKNAIKTIIESGESLADMPIEEFNKKLADATKLTINTASETEKSVSTLYDTFANLRNQFESGAMDSNAYTKSLGEQLIELEKLIEANPEAAQGYQLLSDIIKNEMATAPNTLKELQNSTLELVNSADTLTKAFEEQSSSGGLSLATTLKLIDLGYAAAIAIDEESGAATLNAQAYFQLTGAKIEEQIASLTLSRDTLITKLNSEKAAVQDLSGEYQNLTDNKMKDALASAQTKVTTTEDELKAKEAEIATLENLKKNLSKIPTGNRGSSSSKGSGGSSAPPKDTWKEAFDQKLKDLKYEHDSGQISEENYLNQLRALNDEYFKDKKEYLDDYKKYEMEVQQGLIKLEEKRLGAQLSIAKEKKDYGTQFEINDKFQNIANEQIKTYIKDGFKETDVEVLEVQKKLIEYNKQRQDIYKDMLNEKKSNFQASTRPVNDELSSLEFDYSMLGDTDYAGKLSNLNQQREKHLQLTKATIDQMNYLRISTDENAKETDTYTQNISDLNKQYQDSVKALYNIEKTQKDVAHAQIADVEKMQTMIIDMLKKRYEEEYRLQEKANKNNVDALTKQKELLEEQKNSAVDYADNRLKALKKMWAEEDKRKAQQEAQGEISDLQAEMNKLSIAAASGDAEAISRVEDLQKQIKEKEKSMQDDTITSERQAIEDSINAEKEAAENEYKLQAEAVDNKLKLLEEELENFKKINEEKTSNESLHADARLLQEQGLSEELIKELHDYENKYGVGMGVLGKYVHDNLTTQIKEAQTAMENLIENVALIGTDGFSFNLNAAMDDPSDIISQMKNNSAAWASTTDIDEKSRLASANNNLGIGAGFVKDNGQWYTDSTKTQLAYDTLNDIKDTQVNNMNDIMLKYAEDHTAFDKSQTENLASVETFNTDAKIKANELYTHVSGKLSTFENDFETSTTSIEAYIDSLTLRIQDAIESLNGLVTLANSISNVDLSLTVHHSDSSTDANGNVQTTSWSELQRFDTGGIIRVGKNGGLAIVDDKERVLTEGQTQSFDKLIDMISNGSMLHDYFYKDANLKPVDDFESESSVASENECLETSSGRRDGGAGVWLGYMDMSIAV